MDPLLTIEETARYLNVSKTSLRRWTNLGLLGCVRVGKRGERRFRVEDLQRFLGPLAAARDVPGPAPSAAVPAPRHFSVFFRDRDELWRLTWPYLLEHLQRKAPIVYTHDEGAREDFLERLGREGWDGAKLEDEGLLRLLHPAGSYLRTGAFSPARMVDFLESNILDRRAMGHRVMMVAGETNWCLRSAEDQQRLALYEMLVNDLLERYPEVTAVCAYDLRRIDAEHLLGALCSHPHVQFRDRMVRGFFPP